MILCNRVACSMSFYPPCIISFETSKYQKKTHTEFEFQKLTDYFWEILIDLPALISTEDKALHMTFDFLQDVYHLICANIGESLTSNISVTKVYIMYTTPGLQTERSPALTHCNPREADKLMYWYKRDKSQVRQSFTHHDTTRQRNNMRLTHNTQNQNQYSANC